MCFAFLGQKQIAPGWNIHPFLLPGLIPFSDSRLPLKNKQTRLLLRNRHIYPQKTNRQTKTLKDFPKKILVKIQSFVF